MLSWLHKRSFQHRDRVGLSSFVHTDRAVLETQEPRNDLPCTVTGLKPVLGFDFRFHSGYEASIPLLEFGGGNRLVVLFRIAAEGGPASLFQSAASQCFKSMRPLGGMRTLEGCLILAKAAIT